MRKLIFGIGQIDTLKYFALQLYKAAQRQQIECMTFEFGTDEVQKIIAGGDCALVVFNMRTDVDAWEKMGIPIYDILVDHPRRFTEFNENAIHNLSLIVLDRQQVRYCNEHFPRIRQTFFMPLGGAREGELIPFEKRHIKVLYAGSNSFSPYYPAISFREDRGEKIYQDAYRLIIEQPDLTGEEVLQLIGIADGIDFRAPEWKPYVWKIADALEQNARAYYKQKMMQLLSEQGIEVEVYGNNWEIPGYTYRDNIHFHAPVSSEEINRITGDAQISLNSMPWFKDGAHDRIFTAMMSGAISMTDPSRYLLEHFEHGKNIVYYNLTDMEPMIDNIRFLQSHPKTAEKIAEEGRLVAEKEDTWDLRLQQLMNFMKNSEK